MKKTETESPQRSFFYGGWRQSVYPVDVVGMHSPASAISNHVRRAASAGTMLAVARVDLNTRAIVAASSACWYGFEGAANPRPAHSADQHNLSPGSPADWAIEI